MKKAVLFNFRVWLISSVISSITPALTNDDIADSQIRFQPLTEGSPTRLPQIEQILDSELLAHEDEVHQLVDHLESNTEKRLIRWADGFQESITEGEKSLIILKENGRRFVDVTDWDLKEDDLSSFISQSHQEDRLKDLSNDKTRFPLKIKFGHEALTKYLKLIKIDRMKSRLTEFTNFRTRYYRSATGKESQAWLLNLINSLVSKSQSNVTIHEFPHKWGQNSIIVRFEPHPQSEQTNLRATPTFVVGAHQDSTNLLPFLPAPGADDDGSGTTSIFEALTILLEQNWCPSINQGALEFMWFSAEEGGLLGSQEIARSYKASQRNLKGMVQFDMTAFVKDGTKPTIGLVTDFVDPSLTQFLRILIDEYCAIPWVDTKCGYACSDHASFNQINVPSAFAIESSFELSNHRIHSIRDRFDFDEFSFEHMAEFSKLVLGLAVELTGL